MYDYMYDLHLNESSAETQGSKESTFIWADFAFFIRWWTSDAKANVREGMKKLIEMGYFGFEHGGMIQHDEALSDYKGIIITFDSSLQFIKENFPGARLPKVAFSIDSFGHSSLSPYIFKALGHEALVIYRMPYDLYK